MKFLWDDGGVISSVGGSKCFVALCSIKITEERLWKVWGKCMKKLEKYCRVDNSMDWLTMTQYVTLQGEND